MRRFVDCEANGSLVIRESEHVLLHLKNVEVSFSQVDEAIGVFELFVTSARVAILSQESSYEFDIPFIGLHAISRDPNGFRKPCLYCQLDQEENETPDEMFLVPENSDLLKSMFDAFSHAATLNPDPLEPGEDEGDDELIYDVDEVNLGAIQAQRLAYLESVFEEPVENMNDGRFDDVEDLPTASESTENKDDSDDGPARKK